MQYEILFDQELDCISVVGRGVAEVQDFVCIVDDLIALEEFEPGTSIIHDYSDAEIGQLSISEIKSISTVVTEKSSKFGKGRWAIVTADDLSFGMTRMLYGFAYNSVDLIVNVFTEKSKAIEWMASNESGLG